MQTPPHSNMKLGKGYAWILEHQVNLLRSKVIFK